MSQIKMLTLTFYNSIGSLVDFSFGKIVIKERNMQDHYLCVTQLQNKGRGFFTL